MKFLFRKIVLSIICFVPLINFAQVQNYSYTDCDGNTEHVYDIIGAGKPLLIASTGLDCSICMGDAPTVKTFSEQHPEVRVWAAMNNKYSSALPTCPGSNSWRSTYSWDSIFMFLDLNDTWQGLSYPTYYVISPVDSLIQYQGASFNLAKLLALDLVPTGIKTVKDAGVLLYYDATAHQIQINVAGQASEMQVSLINLSGQKVFERSIAASSPHLIKISLPENLATGIYLGMVRDEKKLLFSGKVLLTNN